MGATKRCELCHATRSIYEYQVLVLGKAHKDTVRSNYCKECSKGLQQDMVIYTDKRGNTRAFDSCYDTPQAHDAILSAVSRKGKYARVRVVFGPLPFPEEQIK